ncbi:hypothetical protein AN958_04470 [Leucoagaricus sp. SymC.cos]|nr:hypothetical protein AN958_04470 [Leucoagaricus sp. SymC.cos]
MSNKHESLHRADSSDLFAYTLCALTYGVVLSLYCLLVGSSYRGFRRPGQRTGLLMTLVYSSLAMIGCTAFFVLTHYLVQVAYVYHRDYPAGPSVYGRKILSSKPPYRASIAMVAALDWLTSGIQIWRLHIIWYGASYYPFIIVLAFLLHLACVGVGIANVIANPVFAEYWYWIGVAFFGIPPVMTMLVTTLISIRLLHFRRRHIDIMGDTITTKQYAGIVAMLIECYALDAIWSLLTVAVHAAEPALVGLVFILSAPNIKVIALLLVSYRVVEGRAWRTHHTEKEISTLRWNHSLTYQGNQFTTGPFIPQTSGISESSRA